MRELREEQSAEQLAARAQGGHVAAFDELARRLSPWLMHYLQRRCATAQDAEDLHQETFLKAYRFLHRYDPARPIKPWLQAIAARLLADHARRATRRRTEMLSDEPPAPPETAGTHEAAELWRIAAAVLDERPLAVLQLRYQQQLSVGEIAERLHLSRSNVKVILFRARKALAESSQARSLLDGSAERPES